MLDHWEATVLISVSDRDIYNNTATFLLYQTTASKPSVGAVGLSGWNGLSKLLSRVANYIFEWTYQHILP